MRVGVAAFVLPILFFADEHRRENDCAIPDARPYADLAALLREPHLRLDTVSGSGVRRLDEAALRIMTAMLTTAPDDAGVPVPVWYVTHIGW